MQPSIATNAEKPAKKGTCNMARQHQAVTCSSSVTTPVSGLSVAIPMLCLVWGGTSFSSDLFISRSNTKRAGLFFSMLCTRIELTNTTTAANMRKWMTSIHNFSRDPCTHWLSCSISFFIYPTQGDSLLQFHNRSLVGFLIMLHKEAIAIVAIALQLQAELL